MHSYKFHPKLKFLLLGTAGLAILAGSSGFVYAGNVVSDPFAGKVEVAQPQKAGGAVVADPFAAKTVVSSEGEKILEGVKKQALVRKNASVIKVNPEDMAKLKALRASSMKIEALESPSSVSELSMPDVVAAPVAADLPSLEVEEDIPFSAARVEKVYQPSLKGNVVKVVTQPSPEPKVAELAPVAAPIASPPPPPPVVVIQSDPLLEVRDGVLVKVTSVESPSLPSQEKLSEEDMRALSSSFYVPPAETLPKLPSLEEALQPKEFPKVAMKASEPAPGANKPLRAVRTGGQVLISSNPELLKSIPGYAQNSTALQPKDISDHVLTPVAKQETPAPYDVSAMAPPVSLSVSADVPQSLYKEAGHEVDHALASDLAPISEPVYNFEPPLEPSGDVLRAPAPLVQQQAQPSITPEQVEQIVERVLERQGQPEFVILREPSQQGVVKELPEPIAQPSAQLTPEQIEQVVGRVLDQKVEQSVEKSVEQSLAPAIEHAVKKAILKAQLEKDLASPIEDMGLSLSAENVAQEGKRKIEIKKFDKGAEQGVPVLMSDVARSEAQKVLNESKDTYSKEVRLDSDTLPIIESMDKDALSAESFTSVETLGARVESGSDSQKSLYSRSVPVIEKSLAEPVANPVADVSSDDPWPSDSYRVAMPPRVERVFWTDKPSYKRWRAVHGNDMQDILNDWAKAAGVDLIWNADTRFAVLGSVSHDGTFEEAVAMLLKQYDASRIRPRGRLHIDPKSGARALVVTSLGD